MSSSQFYRYVLCIVAAAPIAIVASSPDIKDIPEDAVIELPKYVIQDSRELPAEESWRYTRIPGFEVLTNASDSTTQKFLHDFELFRFALNSIWPIEQRSDVQSRIVLCGSNNAFDSFKPVSTGSQGNSTTTLVFGNQEQADIILDLQASSVSLALTGPTGEAREIEVDHYKQFYRAYIQYIFNRGSSRQPAWLIEGISQIVMRMDFTRSSIVFGKLESAAQRSLSSSSSSSGANEGTTAQDPSDPVLDRDFNLALQHRALLPMEQFLSTSTDSPEALNPIGDNVWAKQAYAFVHMCMYGRGKRYQAGLVKYINPANKTPRTEAMFKECFGIDYKKMLFELRGYIDFADYEYKQFKAKSGTQFPEPPPVVLRPATDAEIGRIKGDALALSGHDDMARIAYLAPYMRGDREPDLLASFGLYELEGKHEEKARKLLEAAVAGKTTRARAYLAVASMRFAEAVQTATTTENKFTPKQTVRILDAAFSARALPPATSAPYEIIADTWLYSSVKPKKEHLMVLNEGIMKYPGDCLLIYKTAMLKVQSGFVQDALPLIEMGMETTHDPALKERFQELRQTAAGLAK